VTPAIFRDSRGLFYPKLDATGAGLVPVVKLRTVPGGGGNANTPGSGVNLIFEDPRDPKASLSYRDQLTSQGVRVGLFTDPHWYAGLFPSAWRDDNGRALPDPLLYRKQLSADVSRLLRLGDPVVLDFEKLPHAWQLVFFVGEQGNAIAGWRGRGGQWFVGGTNMQRETACSNEPHQDNPGDLYRKAKVAYIAQLYDGNMNDRPAWQELAWDVADGLEAADCFPCFDAADYQLEELVAGAYLFPSDRLTHLFK
jgi:hypothetical protein